MSARLLVVFVLMSFSGVTFGASPNPSVEERLATLETTTKLQYEALSKQIEANHQATLKLYEALSKQIETNRQATLKQIEITHQSALEQIKTTHQSALEQIEANHQATLKLIEVTNNRIDTLNNWVIALFGAILTCVVAIVTYALGLWETPKRDKPVATGATANSPEVSPTA